MRTASRRAASGCTCGSACECGHVACCDDSPNKHMSKHAEAAQHPMIRSLEPGEDWCYCFIDDIGMLIPQVTGHTRIPPSPMLT